MITDAQAAVLRRLARGERLEYDREYWRVKWPACGGFEARHG